MSATTAVSKAPRKSAATEAAAAGTEPRRLASESVRSPRRSVTISLRKVMLLLGASVAVLVTLSLVQNLLIFLAPEVGLSDRIHRLDVDAEVSLPTWFSSSLMLICGLALLAIAIQTRPEGLRKALPWFLLSAAFVALSLDESAMLHEALSGALIAYIDNSGLFYFTWAIPALVVCLAGLVCFVPFILRFGPFDRALLIGSAVVFLSGAVGMEMLGGAEADRAGTETLPYHLLATIEESLEFAGLLIFLLFLLRRLRADHNRMVLCFE